MSGPLVTIAIPVLNEGEFIDGCLEALARQTYPRIAEVLVVDGGSTDDTVARAARQSGVRVIKNPHRIQAVALNMALREAKGEVFVRVDGHCRIAPDYVERVVDALEVTGAAIVGGAMTPHATERAQVAIAVAMASRLGVGPARFHAGGRAGWVDTVYLGAYRTEVARAVGGYAEDAAVNEDAEFAIRMRSHGGVWFDPTIRSEYVPRSSLPKLARQFFRYGVGRSATVRKHPSTLSPRQLAPPILAVGIASPLRRPVLAAYAAVIASGALRRDLPARSKPAFILALPTMHLSWAAGFYVGMVGAILGSAKRLVGRR